MFNPNKWVTDNRVSGSSGEKPLGPRQVSRLGNPLLCVCVILIRDKLWGKKERKKKENTVRVGRKSKKQCQWFQLKKAKKLEAHPPKRETHCNTDREIPLLTQVSAPKSSLNRDEGKHRDSFSAPLWVYCSEPMLWGNTGAGGAGREIILGSVGKCPRQKETSTVLTLLCQEPISATERERHLLGGPNLPAVKNWLCTR